MNPFIMSVRKLGERLLLFIVPLIFSGPAIAAGSDGRATYDEVMLWVNFIIVASLLYKFGKKPLMDFLSGSRDEIAGEIEKLEKQRAEIKAQTNETLKNIETSKTHFQAVSERIVESGEKAKHAIIEDAKNQSHLMLADAKRKIETQINTAKKDFRSELIDASIDLAMKNISDHVTPEDNQKFIDHYLSAIPGKK